MWSPTQRSVGRWLLVAVLLLAGSGASGCSRRRPLTGTGVLGGAGGAMRTGAAGAGGASVTGTGGASVTGTGGASGPAAACTGPSDARLVVADQRILRLTMNELLNTVRHLVGDVEAAALVRDGIVGNGDDVVEANRWFPPLLDPYISAGTFPQLDAVAAHVATYVLDNFAAVTACATASDACATAYLDRLAARAYRRRLTPEEQSRFSTLYGKLRATQVVNGYEVAFTVEEATSYAVNALLGSPQMLWRWELGDPAQASSSPAGIPLTEQELASTLAFFFTDRPPDDALVAAANAGTLRANLAAHVDALLASPAAREWLRSTVETAFGINRLPHTAGGSPSHTPEMVADIGTEARKFLDNALWNGNLTDLLLSRTAFLNTRIASEIYGVLPPAGATASSFVQTTLPDDRRAGLLTRAAFLAVHGRPDGRALVVPRGVGVAAVLLCARPDGHERPVGSTPTNDQTGQQQAAARAAEPMCSPCHTQIDPYGLALENYDALGRYRTVDDRGRPIDAHATLPAAFGGDTVTSGVELAEALAAKPAFTNCMARVLLQHAISDASVDVEVPLAPRQAGCATADVVRRYESASGKTFTDLVRAAAAAPAFVLRKEAP